MIVTANTATPSAERPARTWHPHVTVATVVAADGRFLLVEEEVAGQRVLNQPAGHLEAGETLQQAAVRETLEETAWHVRLTHFLGVQQWSVGALHFVRFAFAADALRHEPGRPLDAGIIGPRWLSRDEIAAAPNLRSPMVLSTIDDWLAGRQLPLDCVKSLDPVR